MNRNPRVWLEDIDQAGADIEDFIEGIDSGVYAGDARTQAAVERKFEIIGEALNRLHKDRPDLTKRIPGLRGIIDFRNLLAHGYGHVKPKRIWTYAKSNLPELRQIVKELLTELSALEE